MTPPVPPRAVSRQEWLGLLLAVVVAGVDFGLHYGKSNQNTYLLAGLQRIHPGQWSRDWEVSRISETHQLFTALLPVLAHLGSLPWILATLNVAMIAGTLLAWRSVFRSLEPRHATGATLLLATAFVVETTSSVGGTYLFAQYLQPSSIAVFGMLMALLCFLHGRFLASGLLLALGAAFHGNYLVLGILAFGLAHLALGWRGLIARGLMQLGPSTLVLLKELPVFLAVSSAPRRELSFYIFQRIRAPHHYYPLAFLPDYVVYVGWLLLALAAALPERRETPTLLSRFHAFQLACIAVIAAATLLTTVVFIPTVSMLFLWRLAPFSVLLAQVLVIRAVLAKLTGSPAELAAPWPTWRRGLWLTGILLPLARAGLPLWKPIGLILPLALLVGTIGYAWWRRRSKAEAPAIGRTIPAIVCTAALAPFLVASLLDSSLLHGVGEPSQQSLYAWARSTSPETMFLVPPGMQDFRLQSERAVVIDWKSAAVQADDVIEWYRRMGRISGDPAVSGLAEAEQGYSHLTQDVLHSLRQEFGADYAVFRLPHAGADRIAYRNSAYVVLDLR